MKELDSVAESVIDCPTVMVDRERVVAIVGLVFATVRDSQKERAELLLASPL